MVVRWVVESPIDVGSYHVLEAILIFRPDQEIRNNTNVAFKC